jgi:protein-S-isoprenylcysteine O-methyltransferase Ste14
MEKAPMVLVVLGAGCFLLGGILALWRAPSELSQKGRISVPTFLAAFIAYAGLWLSLFVAAWYSYWPIPIPDDAASAIGAFLAFSGAAVYLAGRLQFRSSRLAWGLATDRLVTTGIYRYSRNPQLLGWGLFSLGIAVLGQSGAALLLAALLWVSTHVSVRIEERALERRYGAVYEEFKSSVPRYLGMPRKARSMRTA